MTGNKKRVVVGLLYTGKNLGNEEKIFLKLAKKKNVTLVLINLLKKFNEEKFEKDVKKCDVVYCCSAEDYVLEPLKTVEALGVNVIDSSWINYYVEDKWLFYIKCKKQKIPTPDTILLSSNPSTAKTELREFGRWPIVMKKIFGSCGECVEKANNLEEAVKLFNKFSSTNKIPIIAQEFVKSFSYRVTVIDNKIVQSIIKKSKNWKCSGVYSKKHFTFDVDSDLKKMVKKVIKMVKINICGLDFFRKDNKWLVLEVNTQPAFDFNEDEHEMLVDKTLDFFVKYCKKRKNHSL